MGLVKLLSSVTQSIPISYDQKFDRSNSETCTYRPAAILLSNVIAFKSERLKSQEVQVRCERPRFGEYRNNQMKSFLGIRAMVWLMYVLARTP